MSEHDEQAAFFSWIDTQLTQHPVLALCHAVPSGAKLPYRRDKSGNRWSPEAVHLKREGLRRGVPDVHFTYPSGPYAGMWIEFKYGKNKPTLEQDAYLKCLSILGYSVHICYTWETAKLAIMEYLKLADGITILTSVITIWREDCTRSQVEVKDKFYELLEVLRE
jgi:hypothetical protein